MEASRSDRLDSRLRVGCCHRQDRIGGFRMIPHLPHGRRVDDPPSKSRLLFRFRLAIAKYPVTFGVMIALALASFALYKVLGQQTELRNTQADLKREKASVHTVRAASFGVCHRLQRERDRTNRVHALLYLTLEAASVRERALARVGGPDAALHRRSAVVTTILAESTEYTGRTNCSLAVDHPLTYVPPHPIPYTQALAARVAPRAAAALMEK